MKILYVTLFCFNALLIARNCFRVNHKTLLHDSILLELSGLLVETGGSFKVTNIDETSERIDNAFDKAIADHEKKMKKFAENRDKDDECKYIR